MTFFDSGANAHLIDGRIARQEDLQLISNKFISLGIIGGGSIRTECFARSLREHEYLYLIYKESKVWESQTTFKTRRTEDDFRARLECTVETPIFSGG